MYALSKPSQRHFRAVLSRLLLLVMIIALPLLRLSAQRALRVLPAQPLVFIAQEELKASFYNYLPNSIIPADIASVDAVNLSTPEGTLQSILSERDSAWTEYNTLPGLAPIYQEAGYYNSDFKQGLRGRPLCLLILSSTRNQAPVSAYIKYEILLDEANSGPTVVSRLDYTEGKWFAADDGTHFETILALAHFNHQNLEDFLADPTVLSAITVDGSDRNLIDLDRFSTFILKLAEPDAASSDLARKYVLNPNW